MGKGTRFELDDTQALPQPGKWSVKPENALAWVHRALILVAVAGFVLVAMLMAGTGRMLPNGAQIGIWIGSVLVAAALVAGNLFASGRHLVRSAALILATLVFAFGAGLGSWMLVSEVKESLKDLSGGCDSASAAGCGEEMPEIEAADPFAIYISGMDSYGEVSEKSRSDVNQIIAFNPAEKKMLMVNTPRDYYVKLHGLGPKKDKLTHAGIYGIDVSRLTLADLYKIELKYYVKINFTSLIDLIDLMDGIDIESEYTFTAEDGSKFTKGINHVNAKQALAFARERHAFKDGDRQRGKDQQIVINAIFAKLKSPELLPKYPSIFEAMKGQFLTNISDADIDKLADMVGTGEWDTKSMSVTGGDAMKYTYTYPNQKLYVMTPNSKSLKKARKALAEYLTPAQAEVGVGSITATP
ncbi:MAG: LCP family protein [Propionibacteriaceae bacterium]|jgi:LCP family protein required for cell wall assembly|nr:LCP family protein [Propionibacteriaceae bacterium]